MKTEWQYKDLIDLEYFFHQDSQVNRQKLHRRDRNIYVKKFKEDGIKPSDHDLLQTWRQERTQTEFGSTDQKSPGKIFSDAHNLVKSISWLKGTLVGLLGGWTFFSYSGTTPVNVFHFLLLFIVSQLLFITLFTVGCLLRHFFANMRVPVFYSLLLGSLMGRIVSFFHKQWLCNLDGDKRTSANHAFGIFKAQSSIYGSLFYWPIFIFSQLFAIGFNVGLLIATLLKISTSDLAFGWQSTIQFSSTAIYTLVQIISLPWSWFVDQTTSYPSVAQIEGSRIILKEGIYHLATEDLIAWWPFLIFCLLFYGLFFRLVLLAIATMAEQRSKKNHHFDTPDCLALIWRMRTPVVSSQAPPQISPKPPKDMPLQRAITQTPAGTERQIVVLLVPDDIARAFSRDELTPWLNQLGLNVNGCHRFMVSYDKDQQLLTKLSEHSWQPGDGLFILMEGWMVPLIDFLSYLKDLRLILPAKAIIHLALLGRPDETILTPVQQPDFTLWQKKVAAAGDPYINIFSLISND